MPKSPSPQHGGNGAQSPQISTIFSNSIHDDFHLNETFRAGSSFDGTLPVDDREELFKNAKTSFQEYKAKMKRNKRIWIFSLLAISAVLVLLLVAMGMRHSTQQKQMEGQKMQIQARKEEIENQKKLIKFHREKLEKAKNVSEIHREHLELQKMVLELHERSNQTLMETLNETNNLLEKCVDGRDKLQSEMWNMKSEMERMQRMEQSMEASLNLSESNFENQRKLVNSLNDQIGQKKIELNKMANQIEELKKDIEGKQDELEMLKETVNRLNGTVADLESQNQINEQIIASKNEDIKHYEEEMKILRIANDSKASHEERANTMEKQMEIMRKQLETSQQLVNSEQRHTQNLRISHENEVNRYQTQLKQEKERRDEIAAELRAIKDGQCYRAHCR